MEAPHPPSNVLPLEPGSVASWKNKTEDVKFSKHRVLVLVQACQLTEKTTLDPIFYYVWHLGAIFRSVWNLNPISQKQLSSSHNHAYRIVKPDWWITTTSPHNWEAITQAVLLFTIKLIQTQYWLVLWIWWTDQTCLQHSDDQCERCNNNLICENAKQRHWIWLPKYCYNLEAA